MSHMPETISAAQDFSRFYNPRALEHKLNDALSVLTEMDAAYERDLMVIERWPGPQRTKARLRRDLETRHRQRRGPIIAKLVALHCRLPGGGREHASGEAATSIKPRNHSTS